MPVNEKFPTNYLKKNLVWKSDKEDIASINTKGKITAHKSGSVRISASIENSVVLRFILHVENKITSTSNMIPLTAYNYEGGKHYSMTHTLGFTADTTPGFGFTNFGNDSDTYTFTLSKKTKVAIVLTSMQETSVPLNLKMSVDFGKEYNIFFPNKTTVIKYITLDKDDHMITLFNDLEYNDSLFIPKTTMKYNLKMYRVSDDVTGAKFLKNEQKVYVGSKVQPLLLNSKNCAIYNKNITWKTSNKNVATVGKTGIITAKKEGTCTITATLPNGKKLKYKVTVPTPSLDRKLYSRPVYASFSHMTLNDCYLLVNNSSSKETKNIDLEVIQYDINGRNLTGQATKIITLTGWGAKVYPDYQSHISVELDKYAPKVRVCVKSVIYEDGTKWSNPYYKTWHKKYSGKSY